MFYYRLRLGLEGGDNARHAIALKISVGRGMNMTTHYITFFVPKHAMTFLDTYLFNTGREREKERARGVEGGRRRENEG